MRSPASTLMAVNSTRPPVQRSPTIAGKKPAPRLSVPSVSAAKSIASQMRGGETNSQRNIIYEWPTLTQQSEGNPVRKQRRGFKIKITAESDTIYAVLASGLDEHAREADWDILIGLESSGRRGSRCVGERGREPRTGRRQQAVRGRRPLGHTLPRPASHSPRRACMSQSSPAVVI
jgi:hypothetical protein